MPKVPTYDSFQATPTAQPQTRFDAPAMVDTAGKQAQQTGQALMQSGGQLGQVALDMQRDANKTRIDDATNQAVKLDTDLRLDMLKLEGRNALERPDGLSLADEYGKKLKQGLDGITASLGNEAQKQGFAHVGSQISGKLYALASGHMVKQQETHQKEIWQTGIETATERATLLYADTEERLRSQEAIKTITAEMAQKYGLDKDVADRAYTEAVSPMHSGIIKTLIADDKADVAKAYYDENSASMTLQARAQVQGHIAEAGSTKMAETTADEVWSRIGPADANSPVRLFDMEKQLRAELAGSPDAMKKGVSALRERASAFNAQQAEVLAGGINGVWGMIDAGAGMRKVQNGQAWLELPEKDRHDIRKTLESEAHARESRAYTAESRSLVRSQRNEKSLLLQNGDQYLTDTDPAVLARMSRAEVEAKRSTFGLEATKQLLSKWDTLQKPGKLSEAKMDKQDFDMVADSLGLSPYSRGINEDKRRALGTLQFRVEQLINRQQQGGITLTREQKMDLMKKEMAQEVIVDGGMFSRDRSVPVIALNPDQIGDVVIPQADRSTIAQKMAERYRRNQDPLFAPTEDNLRHWYLMSKSQSANLIKGP
ncbi:hypothetical protein [Thiobacillus denitrificans]|uniref:Uncharacterized protein n=1 Tax=Thiobacillus denitrificans TaxID=36861 RepID=A0A106BIY1_THIDE|nr:hypothetical protein [Thiobacillus denitrificans]KVW93335.1 hypothetical protein ABW22_14480 [Thiobacillus denitrificans]